MRAALYARYSTKMQSASSVDDQLHLCRQLVAQAGGSIVAEYFDAAISGTSMVNRPGLLDLMEAAKTGGFDTLVCESIDRLSRDQEDIAGIFKRLSFLNIKIITLTDGEITAIHIGLKGTMSALFIEDLKQKIRRGQVGRVNAGRIPGGWCYGYDVVKTGEERGLRKINTPQAKIIRRIFAQYIEGKSPLAIVAGLNEEGLPSPRGGQWNASTINGSRKRQSGILHNRLYTGQLVHNRQTFIKDPETGKRQARMNPEEQWITHDLPELRIVDQEVWDRVVVMREENNRNKPHLFSHRRPKHVFSGLIKCGCCGGQIVVKSKGRLYCSNRVNKGTCDNRRTIMMSEIEQRVFEGLQKYLLDPEIVEEAVEAYRLEMKRLRAREIGQRAALARKLSDITRKINNLVALAESGADISTMAVRINELQSEKTAIEARISIAGADDVVELHPTAAGSYRAIVAKMQLAVETNDAITPDLKKTIRALVQEIRVTPTPDRAPQKIEIIGDLAALLQKENEGTLSMVAEERFELPTRGL